MAVVAVVNAPAASLSAASTSLQTQIALKQAESTMSHYPTQSWVNSQNYKSPLHGTANFMLIMLC